MRCTWFLLAIGGLLGGFPPPLAVYAEVFHRAGRLLGRSRRFLGCRMRVAASADRAHCETASSSIGIACQSSAYAFLNLKASPPVRGWVLLLGGYLGGKSKTTSDSDRGRFVSYVMTQKKTYNLQPLSTARRRALRLRRGSLGGLLRRGAEVFSPASGARGQIVGFIHLTSGCVVHCSRGVGIGFHRACR